MITSPLRTTVLWVALATVMAVLWQGASRGSAPRLPITTVSQMGRAFSIGILSISRGDLIRIVNDDADLQHHAYIDSKDFKFDSGDQEPGSSTDITFPVAGTFTVLCGIHPKMKLVVTVK